MSVSVRVSKDHIVGFLMDPRNKDISDAINATAIARASGKLPKIAKPSKSSKRFAKQGYASKSWVKAFNNPLTRAYAISRFGSQLSQYQARRANAMRNLNAHKSASKGDEELAEQTEEPEVSETNIDLEMFHLKKKIEMLERENKKLKAEKTNLLLDEENFTENEFEEIEVEYELRELKQKEAYDHLEEAYGELEEAYGELEEACEELEESYQKLQDKYVALKVEIIRRGDESE